MEPILRIVAAFASTTVFAGLLGLGLAFASRKFRVDVDEKVAELTAALPGLNCGACGYAGCSGYAEALASGDDEDATKCSPGGAETLTALGSALGRDLEASGPRMVARLRCMGGDGVAVRDFQYRGYADCEAARIHFDGDKGCKYGCLGLGTCVRACPVDAISYTSDGLVSVDPNLCIGCEVCVDVCPTGVMAMVPEDADWFVACSSKDKGKLTKSLCSAGCIGCRICEKKFPEAGFKVTDNLSVLDYTDDVGTDRGKAAAACPPKCIIRLKEEVE